MMKLLRVNMQVWNRGAAPLEPRPDSHQMIMKLHHASFPTRTSFTMTKFEIYVYFSSLLIQDILVANIGL